MELEVNTPPLPNRIDDNFLRYVQRTVMCLWRGKTSNIGEFTVGSGTTTTVVKDSRITPNSHISIIGLDTGSQAGVLSIIERRSREGEFVVAHPTASVDRHFSYAVIG